ncbi:transposase [Streptomyces canus]
MDGTLVPTRDRTIAEQSKNYRYSTAHQVVIDADTRLVVVVGRPLPGNRHDSRGREESGAKAAVGTTMTIADGGYQGTGPVIPHRREKGSDLPMEGGTQPLPQASSRPRRAHLRPNEGLEDLARLPPQRRRRPPRHARTNSKITLRDNL